MCVCVCVFIFVFYSKFNSFTEENINVQNIIPIKYFMQYVTTLERKGCYNPGFNN